MTTKITNYYLLFITNNFIKYKQIFIVEIFFKFLMIPLTKHTSIKSLLLRIHPLLGNNTWNAVFVWWSAIVSLCGTRDRMAKTML
jgi:hypothetical protein